MARDFRKTRQQAQPDHSTAPSEREKQVAIERLETEYDAKLMSTQGPKAAERLERQELSGADVWQDERFPEWVIVDVRRWGNSY